MSAISCQQSQPNSSAFENFPSSPSDIPLSLKSSSGIGTSFIVHRHPRSTHLIEDQEQVSSLSASNTAEFSYHTLKGFLDQLRLIYIIVL